MHRRSRAAYSKALHPPLSLVAADSRTGTEPAAAGAVPFPVPRSDVVVDARACCSKIGGNSEGSSNGTVITSATTRKSERTPLPYAVHIFGNVKVFINIAVGAGRCGSDC